MCLPNVAAELALLNVEEQRKSGRQGGYRAMGKSSKLDHYENRSKIVLTKRKKIAKKEKLLQLYILFFFSCFTVENVGKKERKEAILEKIKTKMNFTIMTLAEEFEVNDKTIERDINELKRDNKIKFVGPKKGGRYELKSI